MTTVPAGLAGPVRVTVPVAVFPPTIEEGVNDTSDTEVALTVRTALAVIPLAVAEIVD